MGCRLQGLCRVYRILCRGYWAERFRVPIPSACRWNVFLETHCGASPDQIMQGAGLSCGAKGVQAGKPLGSLRVIPLNIPSVYLV